MNMDLTQLERREVSLEQSNRLIKHIRKLCWLGMEHEAKTLRVTLGHVTRGDCLLADPSETD